jgi:ribosomal protein L9
LKHKKELVLNAKKISMHDVKELGEYTAHIVLHPEVAFDLKFEVKSE